MILHNLRFVIKLVPELKIASLRDRVAIIHLASLLDFIRDAFAAHPAFRDIAIAELVEEVSLEILFEPRVAVVAQTEKILILVGAVEVWAASVV